MAKASPARVRLADFYLLMRRPEGARQILKQSTEKAPDSLRAWRLRLPEGDRARSEDGGAVPDACRALRGHQAVRPGAGLHRRRPARADYRVSCGA